MIKLDRTLIPPSDMDAAKGRPKWFRSWESFDKYYSDKADLIKELKPNVCMSLGVRGGLLGWIYQKTVRGGSLILVDETDTLAVKTADYAERFPFSATEFHQGVGFPYVHADTVLFNPAFKDQNKLRTWLDYAADIAAYNIVVCDYNYRHSTDLRAVVTSFLEDNKDRIKSSTVVPNYYGDMVINLVQD